MSMRVYVCVSSTSKVYYLFLKSIKDTLGSYMERKDLDVPADVEELFPGEILLSTYVEAWKFIVAFKQERQRQWRRGLPQIRSFRSLQSCWIDSIEVVLMLYNLYFKMCLGCTNVEMHMVPQSECTVHIYSSSGCDLWRFHFFFFPLYVLVSHHFLFPDRQNVRSFRTVDSLLCCTSVLMWICLSRRGRRKTSETCSGTKCRKTLGTHNHADKNPFIKNNVSFPSLYCITVGSY